MKYFFGLIFFFSPFFGLSQDLKILIKEKCLIMTKATIEEDYKTVIDYTLPKIVEMMGGKEAAVAMTKTQMDKMKQDSSFILKVDLGEPQEIIKVENQLQCVIPQTLYMSIAGAKYRIDGGTIGVSDDAGKTWYFLNIQQNDLNFLRMFLPLLSEKHQFPKKTFDLMKD
jgi:hypothetical protein